MYGEVANQLQANSKWRTSCWVWHMAARGFFIRLSVMHVRTKFHRCRSNQLRGLLRRKFVGGAVEPCWHIRAEKSHQTTQIGSCHMCAKFHDFTSIPYPSKTTSSFMANKASPRWPNITKLYSWPQEWLHIMLTKFRANIWIFMSLDFSLIIAPPICQLLPNLAQSVWMMSERSELSLTWIAFTLTKICNGMCFLASRKKMIIFS